MRRGVQRTGMFTRRALLLMGGQGAVPGSLGVRLYQVQVRDGARCTTLAEENRISARMIAPIRAVCWTGSASWSRAAARTGGLN